MYVQLTTDDKQELVRFVKDHAATLGQSRIEIRESGNGQFVAELMPCSEPSLS